MVMLKLTFCAHSIHSKNKPNRNRRLFDGKNATAIYLAEINVYEQSIENLIKKYSTSPRTIKKTWTLRVLAVKYLFDNRRKGVEREIEGRWRKDIKRGNEKYYGKKMK